MLKQAWCSKILSLVVFLFSISVGSVFASSEPEIEAINQTRKSVVLYYPTDEGGARRGLKQDIIASGKYKLGLVKNGDQNDVDDGYYFEVSDPLWQEVQLVYSHNLVYQDGHYKSTFIKIPMKFILSKENEGFRVELFYPTEKRKWIYKGTLGMGRVEPFGTDAELIEDVNQIFDLITDKNKATQDRLKKEYALKEAKKAQQETNRKQKEVEESFKLVEEQKRQKEENKKLEKCNDLAQKLIVATESKKLQLVKERESLSCGTIIMKGMMIESKDELACSNSDDLQHAVAGMDMYNGTKMGEAAYSGWMQQADCKNLTEGIDLTIIKTKALWKNKVGLTNAVLVKLPNGMTTWIAR